MDGRYSEGAWGDSVERQVDIYEAARPGVDLWTQDRGPRSQKSRPAVRPNPFRAAALTLGLLCVLLLVGVVVLSTLNILLLLENQQLSDSFCLRENATGWTRFQCSCYYRSTETKKWEESRTDCQSRGADLVIITSKEEQEFVTKMNGPGTSWIGLQSQTSWSKGLEWKWVDGSTATYLVWEAGESISTENNFKGYIGLQGKWKKSTNGFKQWICEKQIH